MSVFATGDVARSRRPRPRRGAFDPGRALRLVERFAYPRRVGTPGERRAARSLARLLAARGLVVRREAVVVPLRARAVATRLALAAASALIGMAAWLAPTRPALAAAGWAGAAGLAAAAGQPGRVGPRLGGRTSFNLVARRACARSAPARVVFLAHYDTKSQAVPTGVRVALVVAVAALSGLGLGLAGLAALGIWAAGQAAMVALAVPAVGALAALAANGVGNRSPGALDNATGLAALLELARTWRPRPGAAAEVVFVATAAEETGLDGARAFVRRHSAWLRRKPTLVINLDSVGAAGRLYLAGTPRARALAEAVAAARGVSTSRLRVVGAGMDHQPFAARGIAAVSLLGDVVAHSLTFHSPRDTADRVDPEALARAARLAAAIARAWADRPAGRGRGRAAASGRPGPSLSPSAS